MVEGCAEELHFAEAAPGQFQIAHSEAARRKAIDIFGPRIAAKWEEQLQQRSSESQAAAIRELANLSPDEIRAAVAEELGAFPASSANVDVWAATEYLEAIPPTAAASMRGVGQPAPAATIDAVRLLPKDIPPFPPGTLLPGTPYLLKSVLGSGGFGAVYKAVNQFEQHVEPRALKFCLDPAMIATLQRERELLDRLMASGRESNWSTRIVKLYGHALDVEIPFLVYEYVAGGALPFCLNATRKKIERNLRPNEILGLIRQIAEGLAFAHQLGLVHRDVKPANVLVYKGQTKLADFGIGGVVSRQSLRQSASEYVSMSEMTADGRNSLFRGSGTPLYMSPEQRRGDEPLPHHDIYSLGVMWYQLLTGGHLSSLASRLGR